MRGGPSRFRSGVTIAQHRLQIIAEHFPIAIVKQGRRHSDLILTRSAYDHKRMRPLKPMVGVVKSLGYYRRGPVGLVHTQKVRN